MSSEEKEISIDSLKPKETVHQAKQRHQQELKALGKSGVKGKALKQKEAELEAKQAEELKQLQDTWARYRDLESGKITIQQFLQNGNQTEAGNANVVVLQAGYATMELSKSQQRQRNRELREQQELERIQAELKERPDPKKQEMEAITRALAGFSFDSSSPYAGRKVVIKDIRADGHCMYRAIADQINFHDNKSLTYSEVRAIAAKEMRANQDLYLPYLIDTDGTDLKPENFSRYVDQVENDGSNGKLEVAWGGHPELVALSNALKRMIVVHQQDGPALRFGEDFASAAPALHLVYQRHAYATGEHYNSVQIAQEE